ncbi:response regulator transcription factor [Methylobacterium durans]|uniref:DNA-binding response regulator n=1 Tax=Methylobacterium durans TaxID=2202825 RepID=A0A2U8W677_9HYPH|nr:response regulator transcription factor [Methylobacterium durans]AWN40882.1 DNA-binding response regulator [Methylobacterium durans]MEA1830999.1 response regulator transcription factor [Methylobacterium durans]
MSRAVGVLVVDGPQEVCPTFRATLEHLPAVHTIGEADLATADPHNTVALVFVDGRAADAVARVTGLRERLPALRTLIAFEALTAPDLNTLLEAGADGFVARSASPHSICTALLALVEGAASLAEAREIPAPEAPDALGLTPREAEVLRFLSAGFSNKEVARRLTLSVRTVETHRLNLRRKTQTGRLKDLVSLARQLGLSPVVDSDTARRLGDGARITSPDGAARH